MDPNANLAAIRALVTDWKLFREIDSGYLAENIDALDFRITNGGFLPSDWQH